jgi:hypothetical protein
MLIKRFPYKFIIFWTKKKEGVVTHSFQPPFDLSNANYKSEVRVASVSRLLRISSTKALEFSLIS